MDTPPLAPTQLRLVVETEDFEAALSFYRDALGLPQQESYEGDGGARVVILGVERATLELANPAQVRLIDDVEVGRPTSRAYPLTIRVAFEVEVGRPVAHPYAPTVRVAFEVPDAAAATARLAAGGAEVVAEPVETPWRSLNARLEAPGGMQITVFEELS